MSIKSSVLENFRRRIAWEDINTQALISQLECARHEEIGNQKKDEADITSYACSVSGNGSAEIVVRENLTICGLHLIPHILKIFNTNTISHKLHYKEGDQVLKDSSVATINGEQKEILLVVRTILNFIQKLSGIATLTKKYVDQINPFSVGLLDTRKTTPGLRQLEKYATACGGSFNHRMGLYDRILIKDNHLKAIGVDSKDSFTNKLSSIRDKYKDHIIEVEIDSVELLEPAISCKLDAILIDNFSPEEVKKAMNINNDRVIIEASGGINLTTISKYAKAKPHFISTGSIVHKSRWLDIGLDWN